MIAQDLLEREVMDLSSTSDVLPFCVYHWGYRSYLSGPSLTRSKDGVRYECAPVKKDSPYGKWKFAFKFYTINPMIRPIPYGMSLFCAKTRSTFPWDTVSIKTVYDPLNVSEEGCIYFIAYTKPVPFTTALYNHTRGEQHASSTFTSHDPNPPSQPGERQGEYVRVPDSKNPTTITAYEWKGEASGLYQLDDLAFLGIGDTNTRTWRHSAIFPIYVMSPKVFGEKHEDILFTCHNATCFPKKDGSNYVSEVDIGITPRITKTKFPKALTLRDCVIKCNQLVPPRFGGGHPFGLLSIINAEIGSSEEEKLIKKIAKTSPIVIAVMVGILVLSLSLIIYYAVRSKE